MTAVVNANLALRFVLELGALAAVGHWGWRTGEGLLRPVLALAAVGAVVLVWALFVSPNPVIEVAAPLRLLIEIGVWTAAAAALYAVGRETAAVTFAAVAVASGALNAAWA